MYPDIWQSCQQTKESTMKKILHVGTGHTSGGRGYPVFVKVEFDGKNLSLTGVEGPLPSGNCLGSSGQIYYSLVDLTPARGFTKDMLSDLADIWNAYHLNALQAGCSHPREMGWKYSSHGARPCPVCGYKLGTAWKSKTVPAGVIKWLQSLPDTDITPAWI
jgi:hypothetical protein